MDREPKLTFSSRLIKAQPRLFLTARRAYRTALHRNEREMDLLSFLVDPDRSAMDVGANRGVYCEQLVRIARSVVAVEPNPQLVAELKRLFPSVRVVAAAVSDVTDSVELRIPLEGPGSATIERQNALEGEGEVAVLTVPTVRIDDIAPDDVGFIKIDVEGHEVAALRGAMAAIARCRPNLLVESEERHKAGSIAAIRGSLEPLGYEGYFLWRGCITSIRRFDAPTHQRVAERLGVRKDARDYVNNFFFLPTA